MLRIRIEVCYSLCYKACVKKWKIRTHIKKQKNKKTQNIRTFNSLEYSHVQIFLLSLLKMEIIYALNSSLTFVYSSESCFSNCIVCHDVCKYGVTYKCLPGNMGSNLIQNFFSCLFLFCVIHPPYFMNNHFIDEPIFILNKVNHILSQIIQCCVQKNVYKDYFCLFPTCIITYWR